MRVTWRNFGTDFITTPFLEQIAFKSTKLCNPWMTSKRRGAGRVTTNTRILDMHEPAGRPSHRNPRRWLARPLPLTPCQNQGPSRAEGPEGERPMHVAPGVEEHAGLQRRSGFRPVPVGSLGFDVATPHHIRCGWRLPSHEVVHPSAQKKIMNRSAKTEY